MDNIWATFFLRDESETVRSKIWSREEKGFVLIKEEKNVGGGN